MNDKHFSRTVNLVLIMNESFGQSFNNKWKNIEYNFNNHSNNCTLNVYIENPVINCDFIIEFN